MQIGEREMQRLRRKIRSKIVKISSRVIEREYKENEDFRDGVVASIASAFADCPIGNVKRQSIYIADRVFGKE